MSKLHSTIAELENWPVYRAMFHPEKRIPHLIFNFMRQKDQYRPCLICIIKKFTNSNLHNYALPVTSYYQDTRSSDQEYKS